MEKNSKFHNTQTIPLFLCPISDPVLALGIDFSYDDEAAFQRNFEQKLSSMVSLLNLWYPRK